MTSLEAILGIKLSCPTSAQGSSQKGMVRSLHEASHWHGAASRCTSTRSHQARGEAFAKPDPKPTKVRRKSLFKFCRGVDADHGFRPCIREMQPGGNQPFLCQQNQAGARFSSPSGKRWDQHAVFKEQTSRHFLRLGFASHEMLGNVFAVKGPFYLGYFGSPVPGHKASPCEAESTRRGADGHQHCHGCVPGTYLCGSRRAYCVDVLVLLRSETTNLE